MSRWKIIPGIATYFVTTTIVKWQFVFVSEPYFGIIVESLKYCIEHKGLKLHAFVIMPNHAHYVLSTNELKSLSDVMRDFNAHTSRQITTLLKSESKRSLLNVFHDEAKADGRGNRFKVWQEGFHPIALQTEDFARSKLEYLHNNPVLKGYVGRPEEWKYSSARNYVLGDHSLLRVERLM